MSAGYSKTPLAKKLGIKTGFNIKTVNAPAYYFDLFDDLPDELIVNSRGKQPKDFIHFFTTELKELNNTLPKLKQELEQNGMIWVSWPKKAAKVATDVTENPIRDLALSIGLVDVKVCALDEVWSGLKLVIPVKDRKG
jgi:hypothetical protein